MENCTADRITHDIAWSTITKILETGKELNLNTTHNRGQWTSVLLWNDIRYSCGDIWMNVPEMLLMIIDQHDECVICEVTV